jgi:hypothetical protein
MKTAYTYKSCEILKSLGITPKEPTDECKVCPFYKNCPEDILNDAISDVMKMVSEYIKGVK